MKIAFILAALSMTTPAFASTCSLNYEGEKIQIDNVSWNQDIEAKFPSGKTLTFQFKSQNFYGPGVGIEYIELVSEPDFLCIDQFLWNKDREYIGVMSVCESVDQRHIDISCVFR